MSDLWFVPPSTHSTWFARLDWYLNWQMSKGLHHRLPGPAAELFRLGEEHGLKIAGSPIELKDAPLMISGRGLIPAAGCVVLSYRGDIKEWLTQVKTIAFQMQAEHARVHLPAGAERAKAVVIWGKLTGHCSAEFIEDCQE